MGKLITLLTDFGTSDSYVGAMKGVILGICPDCRIVDISHEIPPQDILKGAFCLAGAYPFFPDGTIHVAIVDPGVGGGRRPLLVQTARQLFVGPDNGIFTFVYRQEEILEVRELKGEIHFRRPVSPTFHGRDLFAPVAAHLANGVPPERMGPVLEGYILLPVPEPVFEEGVLRGEIIDLDRFGNGISNLKESLIRSTFAERGPRVRVADLDLGGICEAYASVAKGSALALIGSHGFLEIAVRDGSARRVLGIDRGTPVLIGT